MIRRPKLWVAAAAALAVLVYLAAKPVPIAPVAWDAPKNAGYVGVHAPNDSLSRLRLIDLRGERGPEHVVVRQDSTGLKVYASVESGKLLRMNLDGSALETVLQRKARVLGFDFDAQGQLILADTDRGLVKIDPATKAETILAQVVNFEKRQTAIKFADAVVVAPNGKIYFSDASTRFAPRDWGGAFEASVLDILEQSATGRVIEFDPASQEARVVAHGLSFANGLTISPDGNQLLVAETGRYRVWQIATTARELDVRRITSPTDKEARVVLDNLPGYPDNLMRGQPGPDGQARYWVGLAKPRSATVDAMASLPWARSATLRLPRLLWPIPKPYGHVLQFDAGGKIVASWQDPQGAYPETTGATESADRIFIHSLHAPALAYLPKERRQ